MAIVTHREEELLGPYHEDTLQSLHMLTEWCGDRAGIERLLELEAEEEKGLVRDEWIKIYSA
jgi:hypothetical protein